MKRLYLHPASPFDVVLVIAIVVLIGTVFILVLEWALTSVSGTNIVAVFLGLAALAVILVVFSYTMIKSKDIGIGVDRSGDADPDLETYIKDITEKNSRALIVIDIDRSKEAARFSETYIKALEEEYNQAL